MTRTGRTLHEYMTQGAAGLVALCHFVKHLPLDSATAAEQSGYDGLAVWGSTTRTNMLLADIYDAISAFRYVFTISKSKRGKAKKPRPYPRPWVREKVRKIGKDPIPVSAFGDWWKKKMKEAKNAGR